MVVGRGGVKRAREGERERGRERERERERDVSYTHTLWDRRADHAGRLIRNSLTCAICQGPFF